MGKITKKKFKKHFKGAYKKKRNKKALGKEIDDQVRSIAIKELEAHGEDGMDKIVIENISIEILSENPQSLSAAAATSENCFYYCYVIAGRRVCRKICW